MNLEQKENTCSEGSVIFEIINTSETKQILTCDLPNFKLNCQCNHKNKEPYCDSVKHWVKIIYNRTGRSFDEASTKQFYLNAIQASNLINFREEIKLDLLRTFPNEFCFSSNEKSQIKDLEKLLNVIAFSYKDIGYVQGINFVVAALLYHCADFIAYWLFDVLLNQYDVKDLYNINFNSRIHGLILNKLIEYNMPNFNKAIEISGFNIKDICSGYIICLALNISDLRSTGLFFFYFFKHSWIFLYKLILMLFILIEEKVIGNSDIPIKKQIKNALTSSKFELTLAKIFTYESKFESIMSEANLIQLNEEFIFKLITKNETEILSIPLTKKLFEFT